MAALIWLAGAMILIAAEILSGDLWLLMVGLAAIGGAVAAFAGAGPILAAVVFLGCAVGLVGFARPALRHRLTAGTGMATNVEALIGKHATVVSAVDANGGQVKI